MSVKQLVVTVVVAVVLGSGQGEGEGGEQGRSCGEGLPECVERNEAAAGCPWRWRWRTVGPRSSKIIHFFFSLYFFKCPVYRKNHNTLLDV